MTERVLAINGSARMEKGHTERLLQAYLEGMREAGAETEVVYASKLSVKPCIGDFSCWYGKPGECILRDDMDELYPRLRAADILVLGIPVYIPMPGDVQNIINRLCPLMAPELRTRGGRTRARWHDDVRIRSMVLVSTCGWYERGNFGTVVRIVEELAKDASVGFAGAVLRPHASEMLQKGKLTKEGKAVLDAARRAGRQMASRGRMDPRVLEEVARPLVGRAEMLQRDTELFLRAMDRSMER